MQRVAVRSRSIASVGYDEVSELLEVEFSQGNVYQYRGVSITVHQQLMSAQSMGSFFSKVIRPAYKHIQVRSR